MESYINPLNTLHRHGHAVSALNSNSLHEALNIPTQPGPMPDKAAGHHRSPSANGASKVPGSGNVVAVNGDAGMRTRPSPAASEDLESDMKKQVEDFKRSVTIIFWYKADTEPLRLQHMIPTFPYFQLSRFTSLTTDLGLTMNTYLDTYNPESGKWEQHTIGTVRMVESQQRLLYRIRRSLLEGLGEVSCPGLEEEVGLQSKSSSLNAPPLPRSPAVCSPNPLKRPAPGPPTIPHMSKVQVTNEFYPPQTGIMQNIASPMSPPISATTSSSSTTHVQQIQPLPVVSNATPNPSGPLVNMNAHSGASGAYTFQHSPYYRPAPPPTTPAAAAATTTTMPPASPSTNALPQYLLNPISSAAPIPYHPHPPLKRWPNDYTVAELTGGFSAMDLLIASAPNGTSMTQRQAFERVFGSRYVKSTVCRHRGVWKKAQGPLREQYEAMGSDERACWGEFVRRIEGKASKHGAPSPVGAAAKGTPGAAAGGSAANGAAASGMTSPHPQPSQTPQQQQQSQQQQASGGIITFTSVSGPGGQTLAINKDDGPTEEPVMDSLQAPNGQGEYDFS